MPIVIPEATRAGFRALGLSDPERASASEQAKCERLFQAILEVYFRREDSSGGWIEDERRELGRLVGEALPAASFQERLVRVSHFLAVVVTHRPRFPLEMQTLFATQASMTYLAQLASWYDSGFPKVVVEAPYAASLMATGLTEEVAPSIRPPWESFVVELPNSILTYTNKRGDSFPVDQLFVHTVKEGDDLRWIVSTYAGLWEMWGLPSLTTSQLVAKDSERESFLTQFADGAETEQDARVTGFTADNIREVYHQNTRMGLVAQRLVAGVCLAMSDPARLQQLRPKLKANILRPKGQRGLPLVKTFILGKPVTVDCRDAVRAYIEGREGSAPKVQILVRGHWKMQAHGKGLALRKPLHIEPYWRGPEEAPIPVRPHVLSR